MPKITSFMFKYKSASASVNVMPDGTWHIYNVHSVKRKKGHATGLMKKITKWGDKRGYVFRLKADAYGPASFKKNKKLAKFYRSCGFVDLKNPPIFLKRKPS